MRNKEKLNKLAREKYYMGYDSLCNARQQTINSIYDLEAGQLNLCQDEAGENELVE
jgi:hypothetical protein